MTSPFPRIDFPFKSQSAAVPCCAAFTFELRLSSENWSRAPRTIMAPYTFGATTAAPCGLRRPGVKSSFVALALQKSVEGVNLLLWNSMRLQSLRVERCSELVERHV